MNKKNADAKHTTDDMEDVSIKDDQNVVDVEDVSIKDVQNVVDMEDVSIKGKSSLSGPRPVDRCYDAKSQQSLIRDSSEAGSLQHQSSLTRSHWQIIQLIPGPQSGQFFAWLVVNGAMHKTVITIPRVFYLNSKAPVTEELPGRRVTKILPHGHVSHNLIEIIIEEEKFKAVCKKFAAYFADPEVEGVYETKVPLAFDAVVRLGCVCEVDKSVKKRSAHDEWSLNELHMKTTTECPYLEESVSFFYLYHSIFETQAIYVAFFPFSKIISVVVVDPFQNKELSLQILEQFFREACQASSSSSSISLEGNTFKVMYVENVKDAENAVQRMISHNRSQHHGPEIAILECPDSHLLKSRIRVLDDFPCLFIPRDCQYQAHDWQLIAAKIGLYRCATSSQWLNDRIALSRYAHVPVGNFEVDWLMYTADIFYSRALRDQQQVRWISDTGIPDLGATSVKSSSFIDQVDQCNLNYPGAYRNVTVHLKVHHLDVTALLKRNQVNKIKGETLFGLEQDMDLGENSSNELYCMDGMTSCDPAFQVLQRLIKRCFFDAVNSENVCAEAVLQHFYRWLCSPRSKLHDPALYHMLHKLMRKVFLLLMAEFQNLGATVVTASFSKVIINTGKSDLFAGKAYCDNLIKTIQTRDLFEWVVFEPVQFWHSLLFMDQYNYGAIQDRVPESLNDKEELIEGSNDNKPQVQILSNWNITDMLSKSVQDHFDVFVAEFMHIPWKYAQEQAANQAAVLVETLESKMAENLREKIGSHFSEKLLKIVSGLLKNVSSQHHQNTSSGNPQSSESVSKGGPALEFIKSVCAVFALDKNVRDEVEIMKKNLLRLVRVSEYSPEAEFQLQRSIFTLPNVICSYCNNYRDLVLCRDRALLTGQEWPCPEPQCRQPYDRGVMENTLLQIIRQREQLYHLQDLVCLKCNQIKAIQSAEHCSCGGSFKCKVNVLKFRNIMQVFLKVAEDQKFQILQECASWILEDGWLLGS